MFHPCPYCNRSLCVCHSPADAALLEQVYADALAAVAAGLRHAERLLVRFVALGPGGRCKCDHCRCCPEEDDCRRVLIFDANGALAAARFVRRTLARVYRVRPRPETLEALGQL